MARPGKSIAKQSEGRAGEKYLPVGGRVRKLRAVGDRLARPFKSDTSELGGSIGIWRATLGSLLTVGYVGLVLREHQSIKWSGAMARIRKRLDNFTTVAATQFRIAFGFGHDVYDEQAMWSSDDRHRRAEVARVAKHVLRPVTADRVAALDTAGWKRLNEQLRITWSSADRIIELYENRLNPDVIATVIDTQDHMRAIMDRYTVFPDILGIPDGQLKPNRKGESSVPLKRALEIAISDDVRTVLDLTIGLLSYLDQKSDQGGRETRGVIA